MKCASTVITLALLAGSRAQADEPTPVNLRVGDAVNVCKIGLALCPVSNSLCDDPKVAIIEGGAEGAVMKGVAAGTTLCSVLGAGTFRRVFRVTVESDRSQNP